MPKAPDSRRVHTQNLTEHRQARAQRIRQQGNEMTFRCKRCEEKNLRCFVDTATGCCAVCIAMKAECSLLEERDKLSAYMRERRLALLRAEAEVARRQLEVAKIEALKHVDAEKDDSNSSIQECAEEQAEERQARAKKVEYAGLEMVTKCDYCKEKGLRCFLDEVTGQCASCIAIDAECSIFVSEEEWEKVKQKKRHKRLEIAHLKARLAQSNVELLEAEIQEQSYAHHDLAVAKEVDKVKEQAERSSASVT
ncbi:hypothetical protein ACJQWK_11944 [Exserohilum turcicum]